MFNVMHPVIDIAGVRKQVSDSTWIRSPIRLQAVPGGCVCVGGGGVGGLCLRLKQKLGVQREREILNYTKVWPQPRHPEMSAFTSEILYLGVIAIALFQY